MKDLKTAILKRRKASAINLIETEPSDEQIKQIEAAVNTQICRNLPVNISFVSRDEVPNGVDLSKLPEDVSQTLRLVNVGDYDVCACIGQHVNNTSDIGQFKIISTDYEDGRLRVRFKIENSPYKE